MNNSLLRDQQLKALWASRIDYLKNSGIRFHKHNDFFQLLIVLDGKSFITINNEEFSLNSGEACLFPPKTFHSFNFRQRTSTLDFKFTVNDSLFVDILLQGWNGQTNQIYRLQNFKEVFQSAQDYYFQSHHNMLPLQIDTQLKLAIIENTKEINSALPRGEANKGNQMNVSVWNQFKQDSDEFLRRHIKNELNLSMLAKHLGYNSNYYIELFKKHFSMTPLRYLQHLRINLAKEYLEFSNRTVTEIAEQIGLTPQYFSKLFYSFEAISPTHYRQKQCTVVGKDIVLQEDFFGELSTQPTIGKFNYL